MENPAGPGIEPMAPTLAGGFLTTGPPVKLQMFLTFFLEGALDKNLEKSAFYPLAF